MIDRNQLIEMLKECPYMRLARPGITFYQVADWLKARLDPPAVPTDEIIEIDEDGVVHTKPQPLRQLKGAKLRDPAPAAERSEGEQ